jgi:hypothetical protein
MASHGVPRTTKTKTTKTRTNKTWRCDALRTVLGAVGLVEVGDVRHEGIVGVRVRQQLLVVKGEKAMKIVNVQCAVCVDSLVEVDGTRGSSGFGSVSSCCERL